MLVLVQMEKKDQVMTLLLEHGYDIYEPTFLLDQTDGTSHGRAWKLIDLRF